MQAHIRNAISSNRKLRYDGHVVHSINKRIMPKLSQSERTFYSSLGTRIRELRLSAKEQAISQSQLARGLGVKPNTVSRWESGEYRPTPMDIQAISRYFEIPIGLLYFEQDDRTIAGRINKCFRDLSHKDMLDTLAFVTVRGELNKYGEQKLLDRLGLNTDEVQEREF